MIIKNVDHGQKFIEPILQCNLKLCQNFNISPISPTTHEARKQPPERQHYEKKNAENKKTRRKQEENKSSKKNNGKN